MSGDVVKSAFPLSFLLKSKSFLYKMKNQKNEITPRKRKNIKKVKNRKTEK